MFASVCSGLQQLNAIDLRRLKNDFGSLVKPDGRRACRPQRSSHLLLSDLAGLSALAQLRLPVQRFTLTAPEFKQDYPLNLSISVSGGKETN